ncbi:O-antigen ligase family protein, partial [Elusimicrobiota bacterium]
FSMVASISIGYISFGLLFLSFLGYAVLNKKSIRLWPIPFFWFFAAYALWGLCASLFGVDPGRSIKYLRSDFLFIVFSVLFLAFRSERKSLDIALKGFWIGGIILALVGIIQALAGVYFPQAHAWLAAQDGFISRFALTPNQQMRAHAHIHTLTYAESMALMGLSSLGFLAWRKPGWKILLQNILITSVFLAAIIASKSRGPLLGFCAGLSIFMAFQMIRSRLKLQLLALTVAMIIGMTLAIKFSPRINSMFRLEANRDRLIFWKIGSDIVKDHPVAGVGIANVKTVWSGYFARHRKEWREHVLHYWRESWSDVHNLYLQQFCERGFIGLAVLLALFSAFCVRFIREQGSIPDMRDTNAQALTASSIAVISGFIVMNLTESAFQDTEVVFVLYFIMAATLAHKESEKSEKCDKGEKGRQGIL